MEKIGNSKSGSENLNDASNAWDMSEFLSSTASSEGGLAESVGDEDSSDTKEAMVVESSPTAVEEMKVWSDEYRATEQQFVRYVGGGVNSTGYRDTLLKYEDDLAYDWKLLNEATLAAINKGEVSDIYEQALVQNLDVVEPNKTIEAASGIFFEERMKALFGEIGEAGDDEVKQGELWFARQTWSKVLNYIEASNDYETLHDDYNAYQRNRQTAHNGMIRQLNGLNKMAEKYGCKRLTVRDFMTNDFMYNVKRDPTRSLDRRAHYDRETVLAYFQTVYAGDFRVAKNKSDRKLRFM